MSSDITALVTVADNGGSSGRLREEFSSLPPGDLRMALAALCSEDDDWADVLQHRFTTSGELNGHTFGNLLLAALWDRDKDPIIGLDKVGELLKTVGRVLPMSLDPLDIEAVFLDGKIIKGQVEVGRYRGELDQIWITPENPRATPEALTALATSDWITIGPGSWFSSVLPHFLLEDQMRSIIQSPAKKLILLNLLNPEGDELDHRSPTHHLEVLRRFAPELKVDRVLADQSAQRYRAKLDDLVGDMGGQLMIWDLADKESKIYHDSEKLAMAFSHIFTSESVR